MTGGIEQVSRYILSALNPDATDSPYEPRERKAAYMLRQLTRPIPEDILLLSHINLAPAAILLKLRKPDLKIWLLAHGIEVWEPQVGLKKKLLHMADCIFAVSHFTAEKIKSYVPDANITVMHNCLQPGFAALQAAPDGTLRKRYHLRPDQKILLTITRLSSHELYKGYDLVLAVLPELLKTYPDLHYLIGGKADAQEQQRLENLIATLGLHNNVTLCGFIPDGELTDHYRLADLFVMPSRKEGFGLVFIEAMACGTPALGGNRDGSVDALTPCGHTVDPEDQNALVDKILHVLREGKPEGLGARVLDQFGFERYAETWKKLLMAI